MGKINALYREESVLKLLVKFSLPIFLSFLVAELYGMVDSVFVAHYVSDNAMASLSVVYPLQRIIIAIGIMLGVGFSTMISRENGKEDLEKVKKSLVSGFYSTFLIMTIVVSFLFAFSREVLLSVGATSDLIDGAIEYFSIIIFGTIFLNGTTYIAQVLLAFGNSKVALNANIIGAIINLVLDYILIVNFNMGIKGAAIATLVSQIFGFTYALKTLLKITKENKIPMKPYINFKIVIASLAIGVSAFIVESVDGVVTAFINSLVSSAGGSNAIAILGISLKVYMFLFIANFAVASAMQPIASYSFGQTNYKRLRSVVAVATLLSFGVQVVSWIGLMIFAPQVVGLFTKNAELNAQTVYAFRIMISAVPISSIYYIAIFYYQALGKVKMSLFMSIFRHILVMVPLTLILLKVFNLGLMGVWISYPVSDVVSGLFSLYLLKGEREELIEKEDDDMEEGILVA